MATNVIMPSLGFDMTEGKLARWLVKQGDRVERGQAIAEIETEKATVEVESAAAGILQNITVQPNQTVPVGTVMAVIMEPGEKASTTSTATTASLTHASGTMQAKEQATVTASPHAGNGRSAEERVKASPLARRMAREAGLDLAQLQGTGPGGRIMERDVQAALDQKVKTPPIPIPTKVTSPAQIAASPKLGTGPTAGVGVVPLNKMRAAIARRMTESKTSVPHFYVSMEINMEEALKMREQLNAVAQEADKISVNDLVVAACARIILTFRNLNASYRDGSLEYHPEINIGVAVAVEDGLLTPVLRDADKKNLRTIAAESRAMSERARAGKLRADDLGSGTFTISNLGMFGVDEFAAIINPPEAAILAVGAAVKRAIVNDDDEIEIVPIMKVTLSVDHRVADGAQAARFLQSLKKLLENPVNLLVNS